MTSISPERIAQIERRRDEVQASMTRADLPPEEFVRLSKEYAELEPVANAAHEVRRLRQELKALEFMAGGEDPDADPLMREMAQEEMQILKDKLPEAERALALQLLPKDAADARPAMLEIRAG
ncbi:MAG: PCRF domain-containing protein, partial [Sphingobium phenoxybenzoativorans]